MNTSNYCRARHCITKLISTALFVFFALFSANLIAGNNYYFSTLNGDDSRTPLQAKNPLTPWKTINKLNSYFNSLLPGDSVLFNRGEVFYGSLLINKSGNSTLPIVLSAYGSGANPIITAFQTVNGWTNLGSNVWESSVTNCSNSLNMVTVNGKNTPIGRYPNANAANGGYLTFESFSPCVSITDDQLPASPNWTGAEVVIRKRSWIIDRCLITDHTNNTITYTNSSSAPGFAGWGYFIQNDPKTLDLTGEWFLNKSTKKIRMFFSDNNPNSFVVKASTKDTLVYSQNKSYVTFTNLTFEGGNAYGLYLNGGNNIKIFNCEIHNIGKDAVYHPGNSFLTINGCIISDINDNVIFGTSSSTNAYVGNCTFYNCGIIPGNAGTGDGHNFGISLQGDNSILEYCTMNNFGYFGCIMGGNNTIFRKNIVDSACMIKDDGGGIYVSGALTNIMTGRIIENNIVTNSIGNKAGTTNSNGVAHGIYVDGSGNNVTIQNNTVTGCSEAGIFLGHYTHDINIFDNTLYNNSINLLIAEVNNVDNNFEINGNIFASNAGNILLKADMRGDGTVYRPLESIGSWNGNYYIKPFDDKNIMNSVFPTPKQIFDGVTFNGWIQYDANRHLSPINYTTYIVNNLIGSNKVTNGSFNSNVNGVSIGYAPDGTASVTWDNTNKISGASAKLSYSAISPTNGMLTTAINLGPVVTGKQYILKFDILGTKTDKAVELFVADASAPYSPITPYFKYYPFTTTPTTIEVLVEPAITTVNTFLKWRFTDRDSTVYLDNISFYEADVTKANPADLLRFEYNPSNTNKTIVLDDEYMDVDSTVYTGNLTLQPYSSVLLFRNVDTTTNNNPDINNQGFQINENSLNGTIVGNVIATDPDVNQTLTFSILSGNTNGAFAINPLTGVLSVANSSALNFESTPSFSLLVKVQDNGMINLSDQAIITVALANVNEVPVINNQTFSLQENSPNGTNAGTVTATDPDAGQTKTFSIVSGNTNNAFAINPTSGTLTVTNSAALNFEVIPGFSLIIKVQDNGTGNLSSQATITISLLNVNEAPLITNQSFSVLENSANGTIVGTILATDPDAGQTKTFSIISGNTNGSFTINSSTGVLTVANTTSLNFEAIPSFALVVNVQDNGTGNLSSQATMTISVQNINEPPIVLNQAFSLAENSSNGTLAGNVIATDPDAGQTKTFTIVSGNTNSAFVINANTGALTVANSSALNFESTPVFSLVIKVQDNGTGNLSSQATVTVTLLDLNEAPVVNNQSFSVSEFSTAGLLVGTIVASDPDPGQTISFQIISGNTGNAFIVNSLTGELNVANSNAINYNTNPIFSLTIRCTDNGTGNLFDDANITVNTIQSANQPPSITNQAFLVIENSPTGSILGTITASDPNTGQTLTYSILSGNTNDVFAINPLNGILTVANATSLNFEDLSTYTLQVKVQDNGPGSLFSLATITVSVQDINETPTISNQSFTIEENSVNGDLVGTVLAFDQDNAQTLSFTILTGNAGGIFALNQLNGELSVTNSAALDYESTPSYSLEILVQDNGSGNLSSQATITISLLNVNEPPVINNQSFLISENSADGTLVGTVNATDPDAGQTWTFSILSGNEGNAFEINPVSGNINVYNSSAVDYESHSTFSLSIGVQDNGTGNLSSQAVATITLLDTNEEPIINNQTLAIAENSPGGTNVGTVLASDPDAGQTIAYSILSGNANNTFSINSATGILTVNNPELLDFESIPSFTLEINVQDNGTGNLTSQATVTLTVIDVNESPYIDSQSFNVLELAENGTIVGSILASDPDYSQILTYSIVSGNTDNAFNINSLTGVLTVQNQPAIDFSVNPMFSLTIQVTDNGTGNLFDEAPIIVNVVQYNNQPPVIVNQGFSLYENSPNGTTVGTVIATDPDPGQTLHYSILSGNTNNALSINTNTGVLTVTNSAALNFEINPVFDLVVQATDNGTGQLSSTAGVSVILTDINENPLITNQSFSVSENPVNGYVLGTVLASDPDFAQTVTYSILSGNNGNAFAINSNTGVLTVSNPSVINYEVTSTFSLTVKVQDNGAGSLSNQATISITVLNSNEPPLVGNHLFNLNENAPNGSVVGTITASDPDAGQTLAYSILSGNINNDFVINATTGILTVANTSAINYEAITSFNLLINVQDNGPGTLSSQAYATILINDINEPPVVANQSFNISENEPNGSFVGTVQASDPDAGQSKIYSIISGNSGGAFVISSSTGSISVANSAFLDFETNPVFYLVVKVQDNGTGNLSSEASVIVTLDDANESPLMNNQEFTVAENESNGSYIGTVVATDPDAGQSKTFTILSGNINGAFAIDALSGVLTVADQSALDFEILDEITLLVNVQDNGTVSLSDQAFVSVSVLDINELPVLNNQQFSANEFSTTGTFVGNILATDPDTGQSLAYSITAGNTNNAFNLSSDSGTIRVNNPTALNALTNPVFLLTIRATDNGTGNLFSEAVTTIYIQASANQPPVVEDQVFSLAENALNGTSVGTVLATEPNIGQIITYSIQDGNDAGTFTLNPVTGELSVANSLGLDFETTPVFELLIKVQDNGLPVLGSQALITIELINNNEPPILSDQVFSTLEHQPDGSFVSQISGSDPDSGKPVFYSIVSGNINNGFALDPNTGVLTISNPAVVCFEGHPLFNLVVKAIDNEGFSTEANVQIHVLDINESPICNNQLFTVEENSPVQTMVGTFVASEPDFNQTLTYEIVSGNTNNAFAINPGNGLITVNNSSALDFETYPEFKLTISVQDNGSGNLSVTSTATIKLLDTNEPPLLNNQVFNILENSPAGTQLGVITAYDPDSNFALEYSIIGGNVNQTFNLDMNNGILSVGNPASLVYSLNPVFNLMVKVTESSPDSLSSISFITVNLLQQASGQIIYIDPTNENDLSENGSILHPYDSWKDVTFVNEYTYLQKKGTIYKAIEPIIVQNVENVTIGAYGAGNDPILFQSQQFVNALELHNTINCTVRNLDISFDSDGLACIYITGEMSKSLTIENCVLHEASVGIKSVAQIKDFRILSVKVFNTAYDGIVVENFESIELGNCEIHEVNQKWFSNPNAAGSCVKLDSDFGNIYIHNNVLDHSSTGNMSALKVTGSSIAGLIERNTMNGRKISNNQCLSLNNSNGVFIVWYNSFAGGQSGIYANAFSSLIYYNQLIDNTVAIKVQQNKAVKVLNNTFYSNENYSIESMVGSKVESKNNIYYLTPTAPRAYNFGGTFISDFNTFNVEKSGFLNGFSTLTAWSSNTGQDLNSLITDPLFVDIEAGNFRLRPNSPCINKGLDINLEEDFFGTQVPQAGKPDIGFCEVEAENILPGGETIPLVDTKSAVSFSVSPNPTPGIVKLSLENFDDQKVNIRILNLNGYQIYEHESENQKEIVIDLENEKPGIYLAVVTANDQVFSKRIILQN